MIVAHFHPHFQSKQVVQWICCMYQSYPINDFLYAEILSLFKKFGIKGFETNRFDGFHEF